MNSLTEAIADLAWDLSPGHLARVADLLATLEGPGDPRSASVVSLIPQGRYQAAARTLVGAWAAAESPPPGIALALALRAAAETRRRAEDRLSVSPVWTGPRTSAFEPRRTAQVLTDMADRTHEELWVVTYVAFKAEGVINALHAATKRGVRLHLVLESKIESGGSLSFDRIDELRARLDTNTTVYVWPARCRPGGKGSLHMKCAVSDAREALITSANLTDYALHDNMELGVLVKGRIAAAVADHLRDLVRNGELVEK